VIGVLAAIVLETALAVNRPPFDGDPFVLDGDRYVTADPAMVLTTFEASKPDDAFRIFLLARVYRVDGPLTAWAPVDLLVGAA